MPPKEVFEADLDRLDAALRAAGAILDTPSGTFIDPDKAPELAGTYQRLVQYGYAGGLIAA